jgi:hypothetical protein
MLLPRRRPRVPKDLGAGPLEAEVGLFALHMAAEGKAPRTIRNYTRGGPLVRRRLRPLRDG